MNEKILADRYRLTEQIGMGGMAIVYKAIDMRTGHNVAVKVLRPEFNKDSEFVGRFQREAEAASKMTHHNIVNLLDVGMDGENRYLVMEYVQGKTLKAVIRERGRISAPLACQIAIRILSALEHAHRNGIIHRDIKPQNILVHADGHIKVADFGIARIADSSTLTKGDNVMGSVHYFSPEQAKGGAANVASDLYSVGIVLYEMLTGKVPFDGDSPVAVAMQHLHAAPTPISDIAPETPQSVIRICMKAMEKNPAIRYQSARDMAADLRMALEERGEKVPVPPRENGEVKLPKPRINRNLREAAGAAKEKTKANRRKRIMTMLTICSAVAVVAALAIGFTAIYQAVMTSGTVPDVLGMNITEAQTEIRKQGLQWEVLEVYNDDIPTGQVFMQVPEEDVVYRKGDTVLLTVSKGPAVQLMPGLVGKPLSEAVSALQGMNVTQITVERRVNTESMTETILEQNPAEGEAVSKESGVTLIVSGGATTVPDLIHKTLEEAEQSLKDNELNLNTVFQYEDVPEPELHGLVASQSVEGGTQVILGTTVTLTVYRCLTAMNRYLVELELPESDVDQTVRIMLQAEGSLTEWPVVSFVLSGGTPGKKSLEIDPPDHRNYDYTVYVDDLFLCRVPLNQTETENN